MAEQCGVSPPVLALARTDVCNNIDSLTHEAGKTPSQASFGGGEGLLLSLLVGIMDCAERSSAVLRRSTLGLHCLGCS